MEEAQQIMLLMLMVLMIQSDTLTRYRANLIIVLTHVFVELKKCHTPKTTLQALQTLNSLYNALKPDSIIQSSTQLKHNEDTHNQQGIEYLKGNHLQINSSEKQISVYTVPRYPENTNTLLPLSLLRKLDEMSPREFLTYVLNELTLEERECLMVDERQRLRTFQVGWPYDSQLSGIKMAQAGFYSVDDYDRVQCVFCRGSLYRWEQDDVPMLEHARSFAFCRFVKGLNCGNKEYESDRLTRDDMRNMTIYNRPGCSLRSDSGHTDSSALGINTQRATMPEYATDASRLRTYNRWPVTSPVSARDLCGAGFYYTGFDDQVRCFYCAGGISEWLSTDIPWEEHARWFPDCSYLLKKRGDNYVMDVHARTPANRKSSTPRLSSALERTRTRRLQEALYEEMFDVATSLGYDTAVVMQAMKRLGPNIKGIKELIDGIWQIEENEVCDAVSTEDSRIPMVNPEGDVQTTDQGGARTSGENDNRALTCKVCHVNEASHVGLPCGDLILCTQCNIMIARDCEENGGTSPACPSCGSRLSGTMKVLYSSNTPGTEPNGTDVDDDDRNSGTADAEIQDSRPAMALKESEPEINAEYVQALQRQIDSERLARESLQGQVNRLEGMFSTLTNSVNSQVNQQQGDMDNVRTHLTRLHTEMAEQGLLVANPVEPEENTDSENDY